MAVPGFPERGRREEREAEEGEVREERSQTHAGRNVSRHYLARPRFFPVFPVFPPVFPVFLLTSGPIDGGGS